MNVPANKSRAMRTIQTINTVQNPKCLGEKDKKREQSSKATIVQDKENIQPVGVKDKKIMDETKKPYYEAFDLMFKKTMPPSYWKKLAEKRQLAIEETVKENEELREVINLLKTEHVKLKNMARRAELLEEMLKEILEEKSSDEAETEDQIIV